MSTDIPNIEHERHETQENPLFGCVGEDRGVTDEDVVLVFREECSKERVLETRAMAELQNLLGKSMEEEPGEVPTPLLEWDSGAIQQTQEVESVLKSSESLNHERNVLLDLVNPGDILNNQNSKHLKNLTVEIILSKGVQQKIRLVNELVIDSLSAE
ncbi:hypothetical protein V6N12_050967 [Hibiscus sabdariffa]|uniref:Uncharacterized protein n=1 Tax=Hibiscus sabdariffa TaxID=183260 RepID=A0ABR2GEJ0_9ROSI